ncbi:MAG: hypothetical protein OWQ48_01665 [Desulfurococcus sp.]|nr:hypothetical protein [Desulfurococcus sp.]
MPRIVAEVVGGDCRVIIESSGCVKVESLLEEIASKCDLKPEYNILLAVSQGRTLGGNEDICRDMEVEIVKALKGG